MAEHWFCKPVVVGSSPTASFLGVVSRGERDPTAWRRSGVREGASFEESHDKSRLSGTDVEPGQVAERPMASDCKSDGLVPTGVQIPPCPLRNDERRTTHDESPSTLPFVWILHPSYVILLTARGCSSMAEHLPSKQAMGVRFSSPASGPNGSDSPSWAAVAQR
jgi:hypothetical protein